MDKRFTSHDELPMMLTVPETACVLGISRARCYQMCHEVSDFPALRIGARRIMVPKEDLLRWIRVHIKK